MDLEDKIIKEETKEKFHKLCNRYDEIISKGSADIGKTGSTRTFFYQSLTPVSVPPFRYSLVYG